MARLRTGARRGYQPKHQLQLPHKTGLPARLAWTLVGTSTALSIGLGIYDLTARSLWLDEGFTWISSVQRPSVVWRLASGRGGHEAPYYLLIHFLTAWFGDSTFVMRIPSVLAGAATVPLVYLVACRLAGGRRAGVFAALTFTVSEPLVFWQQNARDYAFVALLSVGTTLLVVVAIQTDRLVPLVAWGSLTVLSCYMHPELTFVGAVQVVAYLTYVKSRIRRLGFVVLLLLAIGAAFPAEHDSIFSVEYSTSYVGPPTLAGAKEIATFLASGAGVGAVHTVDHALLVFTAVVWAIGMVMFVWALLRRQESFGLAVALMWLVVPFLLCWIVAEMGRPDFLDRYVVESLPAAAIVLAMVLDRVRPAVFGYLGLVYLIAFRFGALIPTYGISVDDFAGGARTVLDGARPGDCITFDSSYVRFLYDYYVIHDSKPGHRQVSAPYQVMPPYTNRLSPGDVLGGLNIPTRAVASWQTPNGAKFTAYYCPRLWLFVSHAGAPNGTKTTVALYNQLRGLQRDLAAYYAPRQSTNLAAVSVVLYQRTHRPALP